MANSTKDTTVLTIIAVRSIPRIKSVLSISVDIVKAGLHRQPMVQSRVVAPTDQASESTKEGRLAEVGPGYLPMVSKLLPNPGHLPFSALLRGLQDGCGKLMLGAPQGAQRFTAENAGCRKKADRSTNRIRKERRPERQVEYLHCANRGRTAKDRDDYKHRQHFLPDPSSTDNGGSGSAMAKIGQACDQSASLTSIVALQRPAIASLCAPFPRDRVAAETEPSDRTAETYRGLARGGPASRDRNGEAGLGRYAGIFARMRPSRLPVWMGSASPSIDH